MAFALTLVAGFAAPALAQRVAGRELLRFPLGTLDRGAALGSGLGDGLGNPASIAGDDTLGLHVGIAALQTSSQQGVTVQLGAVATRLPRGVFLSASFARAAVADLVRTETDPQSLGGEIPYGTQLYSLALAGRPVGPLHLGGAVRYRHGFLDEDSRGEFGVDVGLLLAPLPVRDLRIGVATFLWRPGRDLEQHTALNVAADARVAGSDPRRELRAGYASSAIADGPREEFVYAHARHGIWEGRAGAARDIVHGRHAWRSRLGLTVHVAPYAVGVAREENGAGLEAIYQFTLSARLR